MLLPLGPLMSPAHPLRHRRIAKSAVPKVRSFPRLTALVRIGSGSCRTSPARATLMPRPSMAFITCAEHIGFSTMLPTGRRNNFGTVVLLSQNLSPTCSRRSLGA